MKTWSLATACLAWMLLALPAAADVSTPADLYGPLFERVQTQKIFGDGKTFVDATPKREPAAILADYRKQPPATDDDLRRFVLANFDVPIITPPPPLEIQRAPLGKHIQQLWTQLSRPPVMREVGSILSLPDTYIVPGGRFREVYYWDTYFTMLGLTADGRDDLVESMLTNFGSLIQRYGHIPNGTRTYYVSRSQPPFFALMVGLSKVTDPQVLKQRLALMQREHDYWMQGRSCLSPVANTCVRVVKMPDGSLLNRYYDDRNSPRDESYAEDVATAALVRQRPVADVYRDLRAGAESGWDFSSRWLADPQHIQSIHTTDIVPVDLNSLLWYQENAIAKLCQQLAQADCARDYHQQAEHRAKAIHRYLWLAAEHRFADYDVKTHKPTSVLSAATLYPLFVKLATPAEAAAVANTTETHLLAIGGLRTTQLATGQQWDSPNGWAPLQWVAVVGLDNYGKQSLAQEIAKRWIKTVTDTYRETGKLLEKYDVEERRPGGGGEYPLQDGFGWTNGVVRGLIARYPTLDPDF